MPTIENATVTAIGSGYKVKANDGYCLHDALDGMYSYYIAVPNAERLADITAVLISSLPEGTEILSTPKPNDTVEK